MRLPFFALLLLLAAAAVAPLAAGEVVTNTRTSFSTETVTCSGELITVEAEVHLLSRVSTDAQGSPILGARLLRSSPVRRRAALAT